MPKSKSLKVLGSTGAQLCTASGKRGRIKDMVKRNPSWDLDCNGETKMMIGNNSLTGLLFVALFFFLQNKMAGKGHGLYGQAGFGTQQAAQDSSARPTQGVGRASIINLCQSLGANFPTWQSWLRLDQSLGPQEASWSWAGICEIPQHPVDRARGM